MLIIVVAFRSLPKGIFLQSLAILDFATALSMLATSLQKLGSMSWEQIARGLTAMFGSIAIMVGAFKIMRNNILDASSLVIMSAGLFVLAAALKMLGSLSLVELGISLLAIAGVFTVIGIASAVLAPAIPAIIALAAAIALLGIGVAAVGGGILALSAGLAALAISGVAGATALVAIVSSIVSLIPFMLQKFGEGIVGMATVIGENAPTLITAIMKLLDAFLEAIVLRLPNIVAKGVDMIVALLNGIASKLPVVIQAAFTLVISFINGLANAIRNNTDKGIAAVKNLMSAMMEGGKKVLKAFVPDFMKAGANLVDGFISGLRSKITEAATWAGNLARSVVNSAKNVLGIHSPSTVFAEIGMYSAEGFAKGLDKYSGVVTKASDNMGSMAIDSIKNAISNIVDMVNTNVDMNPTIRPVLDLTNVKSGANSINSLLNQNGSINVSSAEIKTASISRSMEAARNSESSINQTSNNTDNTSIVVNNYNTVRNDTDINKISQRLNNTLTRYSKAKGVPVPS